MRQRGAAFGQRISALRNRFRPSERRADQLWKAAIVFAVVMPLVAMTWEMVRQSPFSAVVFAIIIIWGAVMWYAWRQGWSGDAGAAPNASTIAAQPSTSGQQQAQQSTPTGERKTSGRQARRK